MHKVFPYPRVHIKVVHRRPNIGIVIGIFDRGDEMDGNKSVRSSTYVVKITEVTK